MNEPVTAELAAQTTLDSLRRQAQEHKRASARHRREAARLMELYEDLYENLTRVGIKVVHHKRAGGTSHGHTEEAAP